MTDKDYQRITINIDEPINELQWCDEDIRAEFMKDGAQRGYFIGTPPSFSLPATSGN